MPVRAKEDIFKDLLPRQQYSSPTVGQLEVSALILEALVDIRDALTRLERTK